MAMVEQAQKYANKAAELLSWAEDSALTVFDQNERAERFTNIAREYILLAELVNMTSFQDEYE